MRPDEHDLDLPETDLPEEAAPTLEEALHMQQATLVDQVAAILEEAASRELAVEERLGRISRANYLLSEVLCILRGEEQ